MDDRVDQRAGREILARAAFCVLGNALEKAFVDIAFYVLDIAVQVSASII